jgi:hypothetical protein
MDLGRTQQILDAAATDLAERASPAALANVNVDGGSDFT